MFDGEFRAQNQIPMSFPHWKAQQRGGFWPPLDAKSKISTLRKTYFTINFWVVRALSTFNVAVYEPALKADVLTMKLL